MLLLWLPLSARAEPVILVFGDSLSAAYGIPKDQGWVNLLQQRLRQVQRGDRVVNASISGETTRGGARRIAQALRQHQPQFVILELGANDGLRGLPLAEMRRNLAAIIQACLDAHARVLLVGMRIPPNYGPAYTTEFMESYRSLARQYQVPRVDFLLDGVAGKREFTQNDGLHPTAAAQPRILDNVWPRLQPLLHSPINPAAKS